MQRTFVEVFLSLAQEKEKEYEKACEDLELQSSRLFGFNNISFNFVKGIIMLQEKISQNLKRGF
jgi:hypothetical protein